MACMCARMVGAPERRAWEEAKEAAERAGQTLTFAEEAPKAIGSRAFREFWPADISSDSWRSCACLICVEVESLLNTWGDLMGCVHEARLEADGAKPRGDMSRRLKVRCALSDCPWALPRGNPSSLPLPHPWPSRFKNLVAKPEWAPINGCKYKGPRLFCQDSCGCGCCVAELEKLDVQLGFTAAPVADEGVDMTGQQPGWLRCRLGTCGDCGWERKYPRCQTIVNMHEELSFRPLDSAQDYLQWIRDGRQGEPPKRRPSGKVDQLTLVAAPAWVGPGSTRAQRIRIRINILMSCAMFRARSKVACLLVAFICIWATRKCIFLFVCTCTRCF